MEENKVIRYIYTFFLGLLLAIFVGVGISTFYSAPVRPEYPVELTYPDKEPSAEQQAKQVKFEEDMKKYDKEVMGPYNRNVSIMTLAAAVVLLVLSLLYENKINVLADGVMLGGLFTLLYSIGRGFASEDDKYQFLVITLGLAIVLYLGYHRFVKHDTKKLKTSK